MRQVNTIYCCDMNYTGRVSPGLRVVADGAMAK